MSINIDKIGFQDFTNLFKHSESKFIDIYLNSFNSFLFLKNSSFFHTLKAVAEKNSSIIRILTTCNTDEVESIYNSFISIKDIYFNNISLFGEKQENLVTITINKKIVFHFRITYDESKKIFNCNIYNIIFNGQTSFFSIIYDLIWNMIEKNETLEKHNTFQRDFIDIATHQLRNPILPIIGFSKNLKSKIKDSALLEQLDIIIRNGEKLRDIANDILDVSRIETNSLRINKDLFDLDLALSNIVLEYQNISLRESTNIKFIYYGKPGLSIKADRSLISQALYNLLNNSYFFTKENQGQEITVSLIEEENNTFVTIVVEDEGPGLPEKDFNQLFTKFYTKTTGGTGLGLFISKKLIEIHGGSIIVKNRSPDIGLKFIIRIPLTSSDSFSQSGENNTKANRILFIDDFPENLNLIKNKIEDLGYKMDYYADPLDAMEHFLPGTYSLVFLGVDIGGIDGFDLYDELKKRDNAIKGYFMTSNKINQDAIEELFDKDMIASNFIDKPISIDSVLNIVKRANNHI